MEGLHAEVDEVKCCTPWECYGQPREMLPRRLQSGGGRPMGVAHDRMAGGVQRSREEIRNRFPCVPYSERT